MKTRQWGRGGGEEVVRMQENKTDEGHIWRPISAEISIKPWMQLSSQIGICVLKLPDFQNPATFDYCGKSFISPKMEDLILWHFLQAQRLGYENSGSIQCK